MKLSAPTMLVFLISLVLAVLGVLAGLGILAVIPVPAFWLVTAGYAVLAIGCLFKGV
jgi:predicted membrane channel-forming protein YqfA (hemolysin III family)